MRVYDILNVTNVTSIHLHFNLSVYENMTCFDENGTSIIPCGPPDVGYITPLEILIIIFLSGFILCILIGNVFVILSVCLFREMRTMTNGLIVSLASADLLVAIIVLPLSLYFEVMGTWLLGPILCDFWITSDVFCCTASILNIVAIALDRYWLITMNVRYTHNSKFPRQRVCMLMTFLTWVGSGIISSSPLLGWRKGNEKDDPNVCLISQDMGYTVFSTFGAFWLPLAIILLVYFKIFKIARRRAITRAKARAVHPSLNSTMMSEMNGANKAARYVRPSKSDSNTPPHSHERSEDQLNETSPVNHNHTHTNIERPETSASERKRRRKRIKNQTRARYRGRLRSSARTLGLIIGGFVFCWLPFFLLATIVPFCEVCIPPQVVGSVALWLGYSNSLLNPAIYAIWDKNFRRSFKRLSTCDIRCDRFF